MLHHPSLSGTLTEQHREGLRQQAELARWPEAPGTLVDRFGMPCIGGGGRLLEPLGPGTHDSSNRQRDSVLPVGVGHRQPIASDHHGMGGPGVW